MEFVSERVEHIEEKKKPVKSWLLSILSFSHHVSKSCLISPWSLKLGIVSYRVTPLPDMPTLDSSNSAANKDTMSEIWMNGDTII